MTVYEERKPIAFLSAIGFGDTPDPAAGMSVEFWYPLRVAYGVGIITRSLDGMVLDIPLITPYGNTLLDIGGSQQRVRTIVSGQTLIDANPGVVGIGLDGSQPVGDSGTVLHLGGSILLPQGGVLRALNAAGTALIEGLSLTETLLRLGSSHPRFQLLTSNTPLLDGYGPVVGIGLDGTQPIDDISTVLHLGGNFLLPHGGIIHALNAAGTSLVEVISAAETLLRLGSSHQRFQLLTSNTPLIDGYASTVGIGLNGSQPILDISTVLHLGGNLLFPHGGIIHALNAAGTSLIEALSLTETLLRLGSSHPRFQILTGDVPLIDGYTSTVGIGLAGSQPINDNGIVLHLGGSLLLPYGGDIYSVLGDASGVSSAISVYGIDALFLGLNQAITAIYGGGIERILAHATGVDINGLPYLTIPDSSAASPGLPFEANSNSGIYATLNTFGVSISGVPVLNLLTPGGVPAHSILGNLQGTAAPANPAHYGLRKIGATGDDVVAGNDSRLTDSRTPTGTASGSLDGTYPSPTIAAGAIGGTEIAAAIKDPSAATAGLRTLGTGAAQAAAGNDSRLSDSRAPNGSAGGHLSGTYPNPTISTSALAKGRSSGFRGTGGAQSVATATDVRLPLTETEDDDSYHSDVTTPSRVIIPSGLAGRYIISGFVQFNNPGASACRWVVTIFKGAATVLGRFEAPSGTINSVFPAFNVPAIARLAVGDYIELGVYHEFGSSINTLSYALSLVFDGY